MTSSAMQVRFSEASGPKRDLAVSPEMSVTYSAIYLEMYSEAGVIVPGAEQGSDLRYNLEISFDEAAFGTETHVKIPRAQECAQCKGSGAKHG